MAQSHQHSFCCSFQTSNPKLTFSNNINKILFYYFKCKRKKKLKQEKTEKTKRNSHKKAKKTARSKVGKEGGKIHKFWHLNTIFNLCCNSFPCFRLCYLGFFFSCLFFLLFLVNTEQTAHNNQKKVSGISYGWHFLYI